MKKVVYFFLIVFFFFSVTSCTSKKSDKDNSPSDSNNEINTDDSNTNDFSVKYNVSTSSSLDTYVIEMIKEYGDSIYIKSGDFDMLIDAGQYEDGPNVNSILSNYCTDKKLDVLIATHGHADHLGGFNNGALNSIEKIGLIIDFGYKDNGAEYYQRVKQKFILEGSDYYSAYDCVNNLNGASKKYKFSDDLILEVINTNQYRKTNEILSRNEYNAENDFSVVVKLTFKQNTYLFTGDLAGALGNKFNSALMSEDLKNVTVYKAAHHGATSNESNNLKLLNYLNPKICVSSAAIINQYEPHDYTDTLTGDIIYQHPRPYFVRWVLNTPTIISTKNYYYNGTMGTIHLNDNGIDIPTVTGFGAQRGYYDPYGVKVVGEENLIFSETQMYKNYYLS